MVFKETGLSLYVKTILSCIAIRDLRKDILQYNCYQDVTFATEDMISPLLALTLLKTISLDSNVNMNLIRNCIIHNIQSSCIGHTILSSGRIALTITKTIVIARFIQQFCFLMKHFDLFSRSKSVCQKSHKQKIQRFTWLATEVLQHCSLCICLGWKMTNLPLADY